MNYFYELPELTSQQPLSQSGLVGVGIAENNSKTHFVNHF